MRRTSGITVAIAAAAALAFSAAARHAAAGGPFVVDSVSDSGVAQRWQNDTLEWYWEDGRLSSQISNATGRQWIQDQFAKWTQATLSDADGRAVLGSVVRVAAKGSVGADIGEANYGDFVFNNSEPRTVVIFDDTGDVTALLTGEENRGRVVGLSAPLLSDSTGLRITKGFALFNGSVQGNGTLSSDQATANALFQATILHELGHLLNLDHAQVNYDIAKACVRNGRCDDGNYISTMHPDLLTPTQGILAYDDIITLAWIYPSDAFNSGFCTITGEIFDSKGQPLKGVNVLAIRSGEGETAAKVDVRAMVSGVMKPGCEGDGRYYLRGIVPGHKYQVVYEPIGEEFREESDFEPLEFPPGGFDRGDVLSPSGEATVSCDEGGQTVEMASVTINAANPCSAGTGLNGAKVVTGRVVGADGAAVSGATAYVPSRVAALSASPMEGKTAGGGVTCAPPPQSHCAATCSGSDGTFTLDTSACDGTEAELIIFKGEMTKTVALNCAEESCALEANLTTFDGSGEKAEGGSKCALAPGGAPAPFPIFSLSTAAVVIWAVRRGRRARS